MLCWLIVLAVAGAEDGIMYAGRQKMAAVGSVAAAPAEAASAPAAAAAKKEEKKGGKPPAAEKKEEKKPEPKKPGHYLLFSFLPSFYYLVFSFRFSHIFNLAI